MINFLRIVTRDNGNSGDSGSLKEFLNIGDFNIDSAAKTLIIILALSLIISILVFGFIVKTRKIPKSRFGNWLKEFLNFRNILIEGILKFCYVFLATLLTIVSIYTIKYHIIMFLILFFVGNLVLRLFFEFFLMLIVIWKNTSDISASANSIRSVVAPNSLERKKEIKSQIKEEKKRIKQEKKELERLNKEKEVEEQNNDEIIDLSENYLDNIEEPVEEKESNTNE